MLEEKTYAWLKCLPTLSLNTRPTHTQASGSDYIPLTDTASMARTPDSPVGGNQKRRSIRSIVVGAFASTLFVGLIVVAVIVLAIPKPYRPHSTSELSAAVESCLDASAVGDCAGLRGPIATWDVSEITSLSGLFRGHALFNQDISKWNVSRVTDMSSMFRGATVFNADISKWNVSRVTNMKAMFMNATHFNQNLNGWDVSHVANMRDMFDGAATFYQTLCTTAWGAAARQSQIIDGRFHDSPAHMCTTTTTSTSTTTTTSTSTTPTITTTSSRSGSSAPFTRARVLFTPPTMLLFVLLVH